MSTFETDSPTQHDERSQNDDHAELLRLHRKTRDELERIKLVIFIISIFIGMGFAYLVSSSRHPNCDDVLSEKLDFMLAHNYENAKQTINDLREEVRHLNKMCACIYGRDCRKNNTSDGIEGNVANTDNHAGEIRELDVAISERKMKGIPKSNFDAVLNDFVNEMSEDILQYLKSDNLDINIEIDEGEDAKTIRDNVRGVIDEFASKGYEFDQQTELSIELRHVRIHSQIRVAMEDKGTKCDLNAIVVTNALYYH